MCTEHPDATPADACGGCDLTSRRSFLLTSAGVVAAALAGIGLDARGVSALPVRFTSADHVGEKDLTYAIPAADGVTIDRDNDVMLARYQGKVFAFSLACPHQNTALRWLQAEGRFQCPKHKSKYAPDGTFLSGRATRSMDRFALRKDATNVVVDIAHLYEQDKNAKDWEAAWVPV
jgi:nitrite reductase/ring-hydroxylating ferredoxin subunit